MPTSLVRPEMVYPDKKYEVYCLKVPESRLVVQYEPISDYKMDGLQPRIDLRPGIEIPIYPEDEVDADPCFNEYPLYEEFVEGPEWTPGGIPPKIPSPEYSGNTSDTSIDTQVACTCLYRQYLSPPTRNWVEQSPPHQPGKIPAGLNSLPFRV